MAHANSQSLTSRLEAEHSKLNLKFTKGFTTENPDEAFGHINGKRFYFQYQYEKATLKVGLYVRELEEKLLERKHERTDPTVEAFDAAIDSGKLTKQDKELYLKHHPKHALREETDTNFIPLYITEISSYEPEVADDEWKEHLNEEELFEAFNLLISTLETPDYGVGVPPIAEVLLSEGWKRYYEEYYGGDSFRDSRSDSINVEHELNNLEQQAVVSALEEKYQDKGLKFLTRFQGSVPVQAFGYINGMRFYFRFRGNTARIKIGPYVQELEDLMNTRVEETRIRRLAELEERYAKEEVSPENYDFEKNLLDVVRRRKTSPHEVDFVPTQVVQYNACEGPIPGDDYNGSLDNSEAIMMFSRLMKTLIEVPEEEQIDARTKVLLYEGWEAVQAWDEALYNKN